MEVELICHYWSALTPLALAVASMSAGLLATLGLSLDSHHVNTIPWGLVALAALLWIAFAALERCGGK